MKEFWWSKVILKFKDNGNGKTIIEFAGLRSNSCSCLVNYDTGTDVLKKRDLIIGCKRLNNASKMSLSFDVWDKKWRIKLAQLLLKW